LSTLGPAALVLIDVVNPLDFEGGEELLRHAEPMARRIAELQRRTREVGIPTVYVNDNFDAWHLGFRELVEKVRSGEGRGRALLDVLEPDARRDYFVLKPMHSGFYCSALEVLLQRLGARTLILGGIAADICVFLTASDAYMRGFDLVVPADCVACEREERKQRALEQMERVLKSDIRPARELRLARGPEGGYMEPAEGAEAQPGGVPRQLVARVAHPAPRAAKAAQERR
jgi:nicotinamidase-related amidase